MSLLDRIFGQRFKPNPDAESGTRMIPLGTTSHGDELERLTKAYRHEAEKLRMFRASGLTELARNSSESVRALERRLHALGFSPRRAA